MNEWAQKGRTAQYLRVYLREYPSINRVIHGFLQFAVAVPERRPSIGMSVNTRTIYGMGIHLREPYQILRGVVTGV